ncbi:MAG: superoxide dismutase [Ni] [Akkermansiaceae bacterium]
MKSILLLTTAAVLSLCTSLKLGAHCQVPCGIYSDDTVLIDLHTHQKTIAKAMEQINELSKDAGKNANQIARWVSNKEEHATLIQSTMGQYFLAQRLKLAEAESDKTSYLKKLTLAHEIIVLAMKCKQTTDTDNAAKLHSAIDAFTKAYTAK